MDKRIKQLLNRFNVPEDSKVAYMFIKLDNLYKEQYELSKRLERVNADIEVVELGIMYKLNKY